MALSGAMLGATAQEDCSYFGVAPMRLSTAKIQNATAQKKTVRLFDGRGLYLEIAPTGSRWWRFTATEQMSLGRSLLPSIRYLDPGCLQVRII
jgi:hypothetical protein